jgi:hypothetical protein
VQMRVAPAPNRLHVFRKGGSEIALNAVGAKTMVSGA